MAGTCVRSLTIGITTALALWGSAFPAASADLNGSEQVQNAKPAVAAASAWSFSFSTYGWAPWMSGSGMVNGRSFDVQATPSDALKNLDWSGLPAWMSYAEARKGPIGLFNDVVYVKLAGSTALARSVSVGPGSASFGADIQGNFEQAVVELGGAYQIGQWPSLSGNSASTAVDVLAGGRYWHQDASISAALASTLAAGGPAGITISGHRAFANSGAVEWVDPFVGLRLRQHLAMGQDFVVRGDFGGFGVGSKSSWQLLATYNAQLLVSNGHRIDGYIGYRALSVDYSKGSGSTGYEFNANQQGPVLGLTVHF